MSRIALRRTRLAVIVPAHDEVAGIARCLASIDRAARTAEVFGFTVSVVVVCDACADGTADRVRAHGLVPVEIDARNVGRARDTGARVAIAQGAEWLAFTDADSQVAPDWLLAQLGLDADVVCGTVAVDDWDGHAPAVRRRYDAAYHDRDDHRHVHGANLGICAHAYRRAGGFAPVTSDEDVGLVRVLGALGARIAWSAAPRVRTSARTDARAPRGFGAYLATLDAACASSTAVS